MMPLQAFAILISNLRSLSINQVSVFTTIEPNLDLLLIKSVKFGLKGILQARHATLRVQDLPWFNAGVAFARLQYEHESIKAIQNLSSSGSQECSAGLRIIMRKEVVQLSWVRLMRVSIKLIKTHWNNIP